MTSLVRITPAVLCVAAVTATAQEHWTALTWSRTTTWEAKPGSLERSVTERSGEPVAVITLRVRDRWTSRITFEKNFVRLADCAAGEGKLVTTDLDGRFKYQNDFKLNGGKTIASGLAAAICALAE